MQLVVVINPTNRDDRYSAIKKVCCVETPVPSQVGNVYFAVWKLLFPHRLVMFTLLCGGPYPVPSHIGNVYCVEALSPHRLVMFTV